MFQPSANEIPKCNCGFNPSINENEFDVKYSEFGMFEKIILKDLKAVCKSCGDKFEYDYEKAKLLNEEESSTVS